MAQVKSAEASSWTCARCEMTVSFAPGAEKAQMPSTWSEEKGALYCLACRRDLAGEAGVEGLGEDAPEQTKTQVRSQSRIEFEINRDPERPDNQIAKACGTSQVAVRKVRARLESERTSSPE